MVLKLEDGRSFAQGSCPFRCGLATGEDRSPRIIIEVQIEDIRTEAIVDTGGVYLVCDPEIAEELKLDSRHKLEDTNVRFRGVCIQGTLHRCSLTLVAEKGYNVQLEATVFAPRPESQVLWDLPSIIGFQGCLERMRFAVDPTPNHETFYFGSI